MKIAQVCPYDLSRPGGVKSHIYNLTRQLRMKGHDVCIIAPNADAAIDSGHDIRYFGRNWSTNFSGTKIDINLAIGTDYQKLKTFLHEECFDIIHFHTLLNPFLPLQVRWLSKSKHIATFHDTPPDHVKGKLVGNIIMPLCTSLSFKFLDTVISVSNSQRQFIDRFSKKAISVIPNGIDLDQYNPTQPCLKEYQDGKFNLLFLGRLEPRKGLMCAIDAFRVLKDKYQDLRLLIAGDGDLAVSAQQYVDTMQLPDIEFLGAVSEETKTQLLRTADLYVAPALYGESFGIVLLEAMASGTAMVGYGNAGYLNVVNGKWRDYFPEPRDRDTFISKIETLYLHPTIRSEMIAWGLEEVQQYEWSKLVTKIECLYSGAVG